MMIKVKRAIDFILGANLSIIEHVNNSGSKEVNHLSIIGGVRRVEYWPTTGTIYANPEGHWPKFVAKKCSVTDAISLAKCGSL